MKIGLLCGREYAFPPAFLDRVNETGQLAIPSPVAASTRPLTTTRFSAWTGVARRMKTGSETSDAIAARRRLSGLDALDMPGMFSMIGMEGVGSPV